LTPGEIKLAGSLNALPNVTNRTWEYWTLRLGRADGLPPTKRFPAKWSSGSPQKTRQRKTSKTRPAAASLRRKTSGKMPLARKNARSSSSRKKRTAR
jgi:hypothetical protein